MKNIHILPTDKPSNIYLKDNNFKLPKSTIAMDWYISSAGYKPINIYITSDEEIKENDYIVQTNFENTNAQVIKCQTEFQIKIANSKDGSFTKNKIILTTDQDLIKDGVKLIDDEFLEWFVKNPSCEFIEVIVTRERNGYNSKHKKWYKIIIPKEESKQEWKPKEGEEVWVKVFSNWSLGKYIGYDVDKKVHLVRESEEGGGHLFASHNILPYSVLPNEPKQEILEEAAEKYADFNNDYVPIAFGSKFNETTKRDFIAGAKWQANKIYNEENINHLEWIYDRLCEVHNEKYNYDYMIKFKRIIEEFKYARTINHI